MESFLTELSAVCYCPSPNGKPFAVSGGENSALQMLPPLLSSWDASDQDSDLRWTLSAQEQRKVSSTWPQIDDYSLMSSMSNIQERKCSREIFRIILNVSPNWKVFCKDDFSFKNTMQSRSIKQGVWEN